MAVAATEGAAEAPSVGGARTQTTSATSAGNADTLPATAVVAAAVAAAWAEGAGETGTHCPA